MSGEPLSAPARADANEGVFEQARTHLERLGYQLLEQHHDRRAGAHLVVAQSTRRRELLFCELRAERLGEREWPVGGLRRERLRGAALAWLAANPQVDAHTVRFDRLTLFVGHDGTPVGLEHEPQAL